MNRSIHSDLIDIHLRQWPNDLDQTPNHRIAVSRWFTSKVRGVIQSISPPHWTDPNVKCVEMLKTVEDRVTPAFENAARLGYVMTLGENESEAKALANRFIRDTQVSILT